MHRTWININIDNIFFDCYSQVLVFNYSFHALAVLVEWQEACLVCKNLLSAVPKGFCFEDLRWTWPNPEKSVKKSWLKMPKLYHSTFLIWTYLCHDSPTVGCSKPLNRRVDEELLIRDGKNPKFGFVFGSLRFWFFIDGIGKMFTWQSSVRD